MKFFVAFAALVAVCVASPLKPTSNAHAELDAIVAAIHSPSTDPATAALLEQQLQQIIGALNPSPVAVGPAIIEPSPIHVGPAIIPFPVPEIQPSPIHVGPEFIPFPVPEIQPSPIHVGPEFIPFPVGEIEPSPIHVGPAIIPFPVTEIEPSPIHVGPEFIPFPVPEVQPSLVPASSASSPLVQIIVNVNQASAPVEASLPEVPIAHPVNVVDSAEDHISPSPVIVGEIAPTPVNVVEIAPSPVIVEEIAPTPVLVEEIAPTPVLVEEIAPAPLEPVIIGNPIIPIPVINIPEIIN